MPTFAELADLRSHPQPAYPQYEQLRAEVERTGSRFADPRALHRLQKIVWTRGHDWCTAVLGYPFPGLGHGGVTTFEAQLLELADARNLDPPLPDVVLRWRAEAEAAEAEKRRRRDAFADRERQAWRDAAAGCPVPVEVRANLHGRRTNAPYADGPLRHVVPTVDSHSGSASRPRMHPAGRALCETAGRHKHLQLSDPTDAFATCVRCLAHIRDIRPAAPGA